MSKGMSEDMNELMNNQHEKMDNCNHYFEKTESFILQYGQGPNKLSIQILNFKSIHVCN